MHHPVHQLQAQIMQTVEDNMALPVAIGRYLILCTTFSCLSDEPAVCIHSRAAADTGALL